MLPSITATSPDQTVGSGQSINPFTNVTAVDNNDYLQSDTMTITETSADGTVGDSNGKLTLSGNGSHTSFSETSSGVYTPVDTQAASPTRGLQHFQDVLPNLSFISSNGQSTNFRLDSTDAYNESATNLVTVNGSNGSGGAAASTTTSLASSGDGHQVVADAQNFSGGLVLMHGDIDLNGLTKADSMTFRQDMLTVYSSDGSNKSFNITGGPAWNVEKTATGVSVYTNDDSSHPSGISLPYHS